MDIISRIQYVLHPPGLSTGKGGDEGRVAQAMIALRGPHHLSISRLALTQKVKSMGFVDPAQAIASYMQRPGLFVFVETIYADGSTKYELELPRKFRSGSKKVTKA